MAKDKITDYSQDSSQNTDVGGVSILGTASPRNLRLSTSEMMAQLADMNAGDAPLDDTFTLRDPDDTSKRSRLDNSTIPPSTIRALDVERLYQATILGARPIVTTRYTSAVTAQTHTFNTAAKYYRVFLMGAGGDGGNADGQGAGTGASASGGNSGNWGWSDFFSLTAITTATYTVGAPGTAVIVTDGNGCDGNDTTWTDGTHTFTCKGGKGGIGRLAGGQYGVSGPVVNTANTGTLYGSYSPGEIGQGSANFNVAVAGGVSEYGTCLPAGMAFNAGISGNNAIGNGAGGGGAAVAGVGANPLGGRGAPGMIIVEEY